MNSFRKTVEKLAEQAGEGETRRCGRCETPTALVTLGTYGGRCARCFEAYCVPGIRGGRDGFVQNAPDTPQQADMRRRLKANRPVGQAMAPSDEEALAAKREAAKAATAKRVAEYARSHGIERAPAHFAGVQR